MVRPSEEHNVFPHTEDADIVVNTTLLYELSVLAPHARKVLEDFRGHGEEANDAARLLTLVKIITPLTDDSCIPPYSIVREFVGGSCFHY